MIDKESVGMFFIQNNKRPLSNVLFVLGVKALLLAVTSLLSQLKGRRDSVLSNGDHLQLCVQFISSDCFLDHRCV